MLTPMEIKSVLSKIASELGLSHVDPSLRTLQTDDVDEFTRAVFLVEGLAPEWEGGNLYRQVRQRVCDAFEKHNRADEFC